MACSSSPYVFEFSWWPLLIVVAGLMHVPFCSYESLPAHMDSCFFFKSGCTSIQIWVNFSFSNTKLKQIVGISQCEGRILAGKINCYISLQILIHWNSIWGHWNCSHTVFQAELHLSKYRLLPSLWMGWWRVGCGRGSTVDLLRLFLP